MLQPYHSFQAKDLQLAYILVFIICVFMGTNLPRLLVNLYELFTVDSILNCGLHYLPPVWFICSSDLTHLLMVINGICNFLIYCWLNPNFKAVLYKTMLARHERSFNLNNNNNNSNNINNNEAENTNQTNRVRLASLASSNSVNPSRRGTAVIIHNEINPVPTPTLLTPTPAVPARKQTAGVVATLRVSESMSTLSTSSVQKLARSKSDHSIGKMIQFKLVVTHTTGNQVHQVKSSDSRSLHIHKEDVLTESTSDSSIQSNCNSTKSLMAAPKLSGTSLIRSTRV